MPDGGTVTARVIERIAEVPAADWDACAGGGNPFVGHAFLDALERSGSVGAEAGWLPQHLLIEDGDGRLLGAAPMYLKNQSFGEYVFDHNWAHAFERAGGDYYPKLQVAAPFTPVTGPRLLARAAEVQKALIATMETMAERLGVSSVHVTFPTEAEWRLLGEAGWLRRLGLQYHWHNRGYASFDDFLGALISRKRKAIRKERREVVQQGITLSAVHGGEVTPRQWDAFYRFYSATYDRKWGYPYLTRGLFDILSETMGEQVVLVLAEADGRTVAGALNFKGDDALYGRNWGAAGHMRFLHFEACYYQAIEYAIRHGLARVEAGTQGPHKLQRGYLPVATYSAHYIRNKSLRDAVGEYCAHERRAVVVRAQRGVPGRLRRGLALGGVRLDGGGGEHGAGPRRPAAQAGLVRQGGARGGDPALRRGRRARHGAERPGRGLHPQQGRHQHLLQGRREVPVESAG